MVNLLRWCVRVAWLGTLVLGVLLWRGIFAGALNVHMALGEIVAAGLAILGLYAFVGRVKVPLAVVSLVWAAVTFYVGIEQGVLVPGDSHWIVQIVHLLLGVGAMGLAEALAGAIIRKG